ncbi:MAG: hypothetical protein M1814_006455 [Vezdaea aestivalis]|nr:MAG: hypothetical protein M1814_006455 [Vezdaea aestivalis]
MDYEPRLAAIGSYLEDSKDGLLEEELVFCEELLTLDSKVPSDSLFREDIFLEVCDKLRNKNKCRIIQDVALLLVPSGEQLVILEKGNNNLQVLSESVDAKWDLSKAILGRKPQPNYSIGFGAHAFTEDEQQRIVGYPFFDSPFMVTPEIFLPFLTRESKASDGLLEVADKANAHSMTVAATCIVEMYRRAGLLEELNRKVLGFSISHDCRSVLIYAHYVVVSGNATKFYRHTLEDFNFTERSGCRRWTCYKFTRNVYDKFVVIHLKRIQDTIAKVENSSGLSVSASPTTVNPKGDPQQDIQRANSMPPPPSPLLEISRLADESTKQRNGDDKQRKAMEDKYEKQRKASG